MKKIVDENFPDFEFVIEQLSRCKDHQLVWQYVDWAMQTDQVKAVEIFTKRSADELTSERMRVDLILESLQSYKDALTIYLEFLIHIKNIKVLLFNLNQSTSRFLIAILLQKERKVHHTVNKYLFGKYYRSYKITDGEPKPRME